jgi:hypothetical protein
MGEITPLEVLCLPHHESFDRSMEPGDVDPDAVFASQELFAPVGGMLQVMNHPDVHQEEFFELMRGLPTAGRLDWTAGSVADWWRATHVAGNLSISGEADRIRISSGKTVRDAVLELLFPDGTRHHHVVDVAPGAPVTIRVASAAMID